MDFSTDLAQQLLNSDEKFPVSFEDAWRWLDFKRKDNAKRSLLNSGFVENEDYLLISAEPENKGFQAHPLETITLTIDCLKMWGMAAGTAKGKEVRKYFLECERRLKQQNQRATTLSLAPFWYQRLVLFRAQNKVPVGYFSIFQETIDLIGDLETAGYQIPDSAIPDISIGLCWAKHLRGEGIEPNEVAVTYPHQYPDKRDRVSANAYPEEMLPKFRRWFRETYKPIKLPAYLGNKDKTSLPALAKMLGVPIALLK